MFDEADKNGDGTLDLKEVLRMMQMLNIGISKKILKVKFKVGYVRVTHTRTHWHTVQCTHTCTVHA